MKGMPVSSDKGTDKAQADLFGSVTVSCKTAKEFLKELDETDERWGKEHELWIYRGQNDASWDLKPSLYRLLDADDPHDRATHKSFEITLMQYFVRNVNLANLPLPSDSLGFISYTKEGGNKTHRFALDLHGSKIMYDFTHVLFAVAQHAGVPTRLLSFTLDPLVAAYFAADTNALFDHLQLSPMWSEMRLQHMMNRYQESEDPESILSWCKSSILGMQSLLPQDIAVWAVRVHDMHSSTTLRLLDHPISEILNLNLQQGVFVCDIENDAWNDNYFQAFDRELSKTVAPEGIWKITVPYSELEPLRDMLRKKRRFPNLLKATYDSVARSTMERVEALRQLGKQHASEKPTDEKSASLVSTIEE